MSCTPEKRHDEAAALWEGQEVTGERDLPQGSGGGSEAATSVRSGAAGLQSGFDQQVDVIKKSEEQLGVASFAVGNQGGKPQR